MRLLCRDDAKKCSEKLKPEIGRVIGYWPVQQRLQHISWASLKYSQCKVAIGESVPRKKQADGVARRGWASCERFVGPGFGDWNKSMATTAKYLQEKSGKARRSLNMHGRFKRGAV